MAAGAQELKQRAGVLRATLDGSAEATALMLAKAATDAGYWISVDGRIGEGDLAALLGMKPESLANRRREGKGPPAFMLPGGGHKVTYRIPEVAAWIEASRDP